MQLTPEQQQIVSSSESRIVVRAGAGAGKTATLIEYAKARPNQKILYLAFNKSIAEEAKGKFPDNVEVRTTHSLAFGRYGKKYRHKLGELRPFHLEKVLGLDSRRDADRIREVVQLLKAFLQSGQNSIEEMVPISKKDDKALQQKKRQLVEAANKVWEAMQDEQNTDVPMPHDGYLKLYQLSNPDLSPFYDIILLDEAQDTNPCTLQIVSSQEKCGLVLVGDSNQNIYGFRGAVDAMKRLKGAKEYRLSRSFRCADRIAWLGSLVTATFKGDDFILRGVNGKGVVETSIKADGLVAYLYRTNSALLGQAIKLAKEGKKLYFVGGIDGYNLDELLDVWRVAYHRKHAHEIKDRYLKRFDSLDSLEAAAKEMHAQDILTRISIVREYLAELPRLLELVRKQSTDDPAATNIHLSTVHKAKGLEWPTVILGDDFPKLVDRHGRPYSRLLTTLEERLPRCLSPEEANVLYVAITRAQSALQVPEDFLELVEFAKTKGGIPGILKTIEGYKKSRKVY